MGVLKSTSARSWGLGPACHLSPLAAIGRPTIPPVKPRTHALCDQVHTQRRASAHRVRSTTSGQKVQDWRIQQVGAGFHLVCTRRPTLTPHPLHAPLHASYAADDGSCAAIFRWLLDPGDGSPGRGVAGRGCGSQRCHLGERRGERLCVREGLQSLTQFAARALRPCASGRLNGAGT